ncbi:uncharacterized protein LOC143244122 isoform X2 [Tachypleus tridentatus]|uniref:uncharacterized protein LOC143244122 isoform X2 n=1 Tax=Tachypleus tridentatus TaxID=6853 RepID=UPI003FD3E97E
MKTVIVVLCVTLLALEHETHQISTVYDVLSLVYKLCATKEVDLKKKMACLEGRLSNNVTRAFHCCFSGHPSVGTTNRSDQLERIVTTACFNSTFVRQWLEKHRKAPLPLTTVISLAALGRMACVIGEVQRPLPTWKLAFSKCFPREDYATDPEFRKRTNLKGNLSIEDVVVKPQKYMTK